MAEIVTERLTLRLPRPEDIAPFHETVASDYEVVKMVSSWPFPADPALTAARLTDFGGVPGFGGVVTLGGEIVGSMGLFDGGLGYMFARAHWGRGYATEIGRALIDREFARHDWPALRASVWDDNPASARVLEKLGFAETGRAEEPCAARGHPMPARLFVLSRDRWEARHG